MLDFIDSVPVQGNEQILTFELIRWLSTLADTLNSTIQQVQDALNAVSQYGLTAPSFTTTEITALSASAPNGTMWYNTTTNHLVALINGSVVTVV